MIIIGGLKQPDNVVTEFSPSHGVNFWVRCASGNVYSTHRQLRIATIMQQTNKQTMHAEEVPRKA